MDSIISLRMEGPAFSSLPEAEAFFKKQNFAAFGKGSTEDHEEYRILEVRDNKLFFVNDNTVLRRTASTKKGEFIMTNDNAGKPAVGVLTEKGIEFLNWQDKY